MVIVMASSAMVVMSDARSVVAVVAVVAVVGLFVKRRKRMFDAVTGVMARR